MATPRCPKCRSEEDPSHVDGIHTFSCDSCGCFWLPCPYCGHTLAYITEEEVDTTPCKHVAVWLNDSGVYWEDAKLEKEYEQFLRSNEPCLDLLDGFLKKKGLTDRRTLWECPKGGCYWTFVFKKRAKGSSKK